MRSWEDESARPPRRFLVVLVPMRRLVVILLASLAALGGVAFALGAIPAAGTRAGFTVSVTPARQSAVRGEAVRFSVGLVRARSFTGASRLRVAGLPRGVRARWQLADGTRSGRVPMTESGAVLTLRASARTPLGSRRVTVLATGDRITRRRRLTLTVEPLRSRHFSLRAGPRRRVVPQGASATYKLRVARAAGFRERVKLRVLRLPRGVTATWTPTALTVRTRADQRLGSARLVIEGTSRVRRRARARRAAVRRYAVVVLTVVTSRRLAVRGDLSTLLYPGGSGPLDLVLTNPHGFDLRVAALRVRVDARTSRPGCSGDAHYAVTQYRGPYPLTLGPGSTRLSALVRDPAAWPRIAMHDLPTNQDACKDARLALHYEVLATR
jgi:hypothetical protein